MNRRMWFLVFTLIALVSIAPRSLMAQVNQADSIVATQTMNQNQPNEASAIVVKFDTAGAGAAGAAAGAGKSTIKPGVIAGATSSAFPGAGFAYLLFLKTGEVQPNFEEQAFLKDKSPEYVHAWSQSYDEALTQRQKKSIVIGAAVGSVIGYFLVLKPLLNLRSNYNY